MATSQIHANLSHEEVGPYNAKLFMARLGDLRKGEVKDSLKDLHAAGVITRAELDQKLSQLVNIINNDPAAVPSHQVTTKKQRLGIMPKA